MRKMKNSAVQPPVLQKHMPFKKKIESQIIFYNSSLNNENPIIIFETHDLQRLYFRIENQT